MALKRIKEHMLGFRNGFNSETFSATANQTLFTLTNGSYQVGKNRLEVYIQGAKQATGAFSETSENSFTLSEGVPAGTLVEAKWYETIIPAVGGHNQSHLKGGVDALDITQLQNYKEQVSDKFIAVDNQLADIASNRVYVEDFEKVIPEADDSARIQRAINQAGLNGVVDFKKDTIYTIGNPVTPMNFQTWNCEGVSFGGNGTNIGIHFKGTATASNSKVTINGITLSNFDIAIKMESYTTPANGCYYNNFNNLRITYSRVGFYIGKNCNINNILTSTFSSMTETSVYIEDDAYKNNVIGCSIEGKAESTGIKDYGTHSTIIGNYLELLTVGIDCLGTSITIGNYFNAVTTKMTTSHYNVNMDFDTDYYPYIQIGTTRFKSTNDQISIEEIGTPKTRFIIPQAIRSTKGQFELLAYRPQIDFRDTDTANGAKRYKLRSQLGKLGWFNETDANIANMTQEGNFKANNGINGGAFTTATRPTLGLTIGTMIIDTTLQKIIWWDGTVWKDAMGTVV